MRNVFHVITKIIGVWLAAWSLLSWIRALFYIGESISLNPESGLYISKGPMLIGGISLISAGLSILFARVLVFKTDWVADKLKVPKAEDICKLPERSDLLPLGIQLVCLYFLMSQITWMTDGISDSLAHRGIQHQESPFLLAVTLALPNLVPIILAVLCLFKADAIATFITNKANAKWPKILAFTLLALGLLIAVVTWLVTANQ